MAFILNEWKRKKKHKSGLNLAIYTRHVHFTHPHLINFQHGFPYKQDPHNKGFQYISYSCSILVWKYFLQMSSRRIITISEIQQRNPDVSNFRHCQGISPSRIVQKSNIYFSYFIFFSSLRLRFASKIFSYRFGTAYVFNERKKSFEFQSNYYFHFRASI